MIWNLKWCITFSSCFSKFQKNGFRSSWTRPSKIDPELAWHAVLKKAGIELDLLTDVDILLRELEEEYTMHSINMEKRLINVWMIVMKIRNPYLLIIGMWRICVGRKWCKSCPHLFLNGSNILYYSIKVS